MKLYVVLFALLAVLAQTYLSQAELTDSSSDNDNLGHALNKRWSKQWGKRWQKAWGKRSENDIDELYHNILRELNHNARQKQLENSQYSSDNHRNPLTLEEFMAQRSSWSDDNENQAKTTS